MQDLKIVFLSIVMVAAFTSNLANAVTGGKGSVGKVGTCNTGGHNANSEETGVGCCCLSAQGGKDCCISGQGGEGCCIAGQGGESCCISEKGGKGCCTLF